MQSVQVSNMNPVGLESTIGYRVFKAVVDVNRGDKIQVWMGDEDCYHRLPSITALAMIVGFEVIENIAYMHQSNIVILVNHKPRIFIEYDKVGHEYCN